MLKQLPTEVQRKCYQKTIFNNMSYKYFNTKNNLKTPYSGSYAKILNPCTKNSNVLIMLKTRAIYSAKPYFSLLINMMLKHTPTAGALPEFLIYTPKIPCYSGSSAKILNFHEKNTLLQYWRYSSLDTSTLLHYKIH